MTKYTFTFYGRTAGALGISQRLTATRTAESEDAARLALYDEFEHILVLTVDTAPTDTLQA